MKALALIAAGLFLTLSAGAQLPQPFQAKADLSKNPKLEVIGIQSLELKTLVIAVGCTPQLFFPVRSGEVTIRRVVNKDDPNSIWYE